MTIVHKFAIVFLLLVVGWILEVLKTLAVLHVRP
jgi:hypothetical protein